MRPERLSLDPSLPTADKEWKHWIKTFENYVASFPERPEGQAPVKKNYVY